MSHLGTISRSANVASRLKRRASQPKAAASPFSIPSETAIKVIERFDIIHLPLQSALTAIAIQALATETLFPHTFFRYSFRAKSKQSFRGFRLSRSVICHPLAERREVHS
ncbi:uncharacterized protein TrAFT101_011989 [Trichoderma asperellum]|uniref:uncharacterized protein n=1 Tax=Trichoderma asperellum TaxID=101201 RepID=UPI00332282FC|nr:hypothetical protein TrAFT101_011989 [Trichoderma asperellum]